MTHAQSLMDNYQLCEDDLAHEPSDDYKDVNEAEFTKGRVNLSGKIFAWESSLARYIMDFTGVPCYLDNKKTAGFGVEPGKGIMFYGITEEVELAKELYTELRSIISTMAYGLYFSVYKGDGGLYAQGFVRGLQSNIQNKKINCIQSNSLIVLRRNDLIKYKQIKSNEWLTKTTGIKLSKTQASSGAKGNINAYHTGVQHGKSQEVSVNITRKIT